MVEADGDIEECWYSPPWGGGCVSWFLFASLLPLKAAIHMTIPDISTARWARYCSLTICMAVVWLVLLAGLMNLTLAKMGCALGISETVMGLTLGAIGTSYPNLYASVLTARAGQANMSLCQAFGSNTFNLCICLGLVWLLQTVMGSCYLGRGGHTVLPASFGGWCAGCYMPNGLVPLCPYVEGAGTATRAPGSLAGAAVVVFVAIAVFIGAATLQGGRLSKSSAYLFLALYVLYVLYEVAATYQVIPPLCLVDSLCI